MEDDTTRRKRRRTHCHTPAATDETGADATSTLTRGQQQATLTVADESCPSMRLTLWRDKALWAELLRAAGAQGRVHAGTRAVS